MRIALDEKDLVKYPFLKESQQFIASQTEALDTFLSTESGKRALSLAADRIEQAIRQSPQAMPEERAPLFDRYGVRLSLASYALARVIASCMHDRMIPDRLARYEAWRSFRFLIEEEGGKKAHVADSLGIDPGSATIPVVTYIEIAAGMREDRWRLVNRDVWEGRVRIHTGELDELLRERIRVVIARQFPTRVPSSVCERVAPYVARVTAVHQERMLEQFGEVDETSFPPCMQAIIAALCGGTNLPHTGRFALTAFLHNIGMESSAIIEMYCSAPDFDLQRTMYQVEHITGRGGTEYTAPSCAAMKTTGLCVKRDPVCDKVSHPLSYYRLKKRVKERSGGMPAEVKPDPAHEDEKAGKGEDVPGPHGRGNGDARNGKDGGKGGKEDDEDDKTRDAGDQVTHPGQHIP